MLTLSSTAEAAAAIRIAHEVSLAAYTLGKGVLFRALSRAARGGAHVRVDLEGAPFGADGDAIGRANRRVATALRRAGATVELHGASQAPLHAKELRVDGALYLDDCNWRRADFVLRDDDPRDVSKATEKRTALKDEATLLASSQADSVCVETESFGGDNAVYDAIDALAKKGAQVRLLVCSRELRSNPRERSVLARLEREGVDVRAGTAEDKIVVAGSDAWIGSANATAALGDEIDWGATTTDSAIIAALGARFESNWNRSAALRPSTSSG